MRITARNKAAFASAAIQAFEQELVRHLREYVPLDASLLGEEGMRTAVRLGIERARRWGFDLRGSVQLYVDMMFLFGSDFDTDPQFPWARAILEDRGQRDQMARADRLYGETCHFMNQARGPGAAAAYAALGRCAQLRFEDVLPAYQDAEDHAFRALSTVYPERCAAMGESAARAGIRSSMATARRYVNDSPETRKDLALFVFLGFFFGHGFDVDPVVPWIGAILRDPSRDASRRSALLHDVVYAFIADMMNRSNGKSSP